PSPQPEPDAVPTEEPDARDDLTTPALSPDVANAMDDATITPEIAAAEQAEETTPEEEATPDASQDDATPDPVSENAAQSPSTTPADVTVRSLQTTPEPMALDEGEASLPDEQPDAAQPESSAQPAMTDEDEGAGDAGEPEQVSDALPTPLQPELSGEFADASPMPAGDEMSDSTPEPSAEPTPEPAPTPEPLPTIKPMGETTVYYFDGSRYYHRTTNCGSMRNAPGHTLIEARDSGKPACSGCDPVALSMIDEEMAVWCGNDAVFHITDECPALTNRWTAMTLNAAWLEEGMNGCELCGSSRYVEYYTQNPVTTPVPAPPQID
ncbi:MAG: hypothetical protein Q4D04_09250, partial [Clostridia bacterium]|nr:hypothetical protein [Clostridia bacterium]